MDEDHKPRITDFGLSTAIDSQASSAVATSRGGKGAIRWQAPELLNVEQSESSPGTVTRKSDVYAYACVCLEVSWFLDFWCSSYSDEQSGSAGF